jgi:hypothetical protein
MASDISSVVASRVYSLGMLVKNLSLMIVRHGSVTASSPQASTDLLSTGSLYQLFLKIDVLVCLIEAKVSVSGATVLLFVDDAQDLFDFLAILVGLVPLKAHYILHLMCLVVVCASSFQ